MSAERREVLRRMLTAYWLRPETALWYAHESVVARRLLGELEGPSLELGTMEGVSTFVMLGGEFGPEFDVYREVDLESDDVFDAGDRGDDEVGVVEVPRRGFDAGFVWKEAHRRKANRLRIHGELVMDDPNQPLTTLEDGRFATIWAPNLYWVDELEQLLRELRRVGREGGRIVTVLPDAAAVEHALLKRVHGADPAWLDRLDGGRSRNIGRQARTIDGWRELFDRVDLRVRRHEPYLPAPVFTVNDIGLRPLFRPLMRAYSVLREHRPEDWLAVKQEWTQTCFEYLAPLCDTDWLAGQPTVWHGFELEVTP